MSTGDAPKPWGVRPLPPLLAAGVFAALGHRSAAVVLLGIAAALLAVGVLSPTTATRLDRAVARIAVGVATGLSRLLGMLAFLFGVFPAWALARVTGRDPLRSPTTIRSSWSSHATGASRAEDGLPDASTRSGARDLPSGPRTVRQTAVAAVAILGVAALSITAAAVATGRPAGWPLNRELGNTATPPDEPIQARPIETNEFDGFRIDDYAFADEPWAPALFGELKQLRYVPDPFLGARFNDSTGEHVNIVDGRRASWEPDEPELIVWFFGGSTMFGIGQRDHHTIPSVTAKAAADDGTRIRALNFGVPGYVNWQSLERFQQAITSDLDPPDLVVFYDGANDRGLGTQRLDIGDRRADGITRLPLSEEERDEWHAANGRPPEMPWSEERANLEIDLAAQQYRRGADIAGRLGRSFGVPVLFVWQPQPFAKQSNPADDPLWERLDFNPAWLEGSRITYLEIARRSGVDLIDLSSVLDDVRVPIYFDSSHTNELGARVVGEALYQELRPHMQRTRE